MSAPATTAATGGAATDAALKAALDRDGFVGFGPPAIDEATFTALAAEAEAQKAKGWGRPTGESVDHRAWRAPLGPAARAFLAAPEVLQLMERLTGEPVAPSFEATCFTYYQGPEDYLGTHTDRPGACSYTLIVYLVAAWPQGADPGDGLTLQVFARDDEAGRTPVVAIATRPNVAVVGRGAQFPHRRPPLRAGEAVVALTACYGPAGAAKVLPAEPALVVALIEEGFAEWRQGRFDDARARFGKALEHDPGSDGAWAGQGFAMWSQGRFAEALEAFMQAARCDGSLASHWSNIGLCLREMKAWERAKHAFAVALMLDADYAPAINEWANVLQDEGRFGEAVPLYHRALAIDPTRAVVHHNLGVAYTRTNEPMLAVHAFAAALDRDPNYTHSLEELALLHARAGQRQGAADLLRQAATPRAEALLQSLAAEG